MDWNTLQRKKRKERCEVYQCPDGLVFTKLPGELSNNRWVYKDNPWNGIGEKEYRNKIIVLDNTSPWERNEEN